MQFQSLVYGEKTSVSRPYTLIVIIIVNAGHVYRIFGFVQWKICLFSSSYGSLPVILYIVYTRLQGISRLT